MVFTLDVFTDMDKLSKTQAMIIVSGRMPSAFSPGDSFRSQKVEFADIKLGVLIYPKGTDSASEGLTRVYLKNYSDRAGIFDVTVSLKDKDKRVNHLPLNKRRCKMIGEFPGPEKTDGHSPLLTVEVALTVQGGRIERDVIEGVSTNPSYSELRDGITQLGNEIKETLLDMRKENLELRNELSDLKIEIRRQFPSCLICLQQMSYPTKVVQCARGHKVCEPCTELQKVKFIFNIFNLINKESQLQEIYC